MASEWLTANVKDGVVEQTTSQTTATKSRNDEMGKDAFLQLLVAQMKYQDPLEPTDNTQYISQLATFSQLEQMQNLNQTSINSQAFSLVGKEVIMKNTSTTGNVTYTQGVVEFVTMNGNKTFLSIDGNLYSANDLFSVVGENYIASQKGPKVEPKEMEYNHNEPKDITFKISLGEDEYEASQLAVFVNGVVLSSEFLTYDKNNNEVTISGEAFKGLDADTYKLAVMFDDINTTTYTDRLILKVKGDKPKIEEPEDSENPEVPDEEDEVKEPENNGEGEP